jgi:ribonuclease-3
MASSSEPGAAADPAALRKWLGHGFAQPDLLVQALTHPSAATRRGAGEDSYERLEFLGDRVLGLIVADLLLARFPDEQEGSLAVRHTELVRRETLAEIAGEIGLERYLRLAKGEEAAGERHNPALLANACEAVIGALYLDGGLDAAQAFVAPLWRERLESAVQPPQDAKTALQEWAQGRALGLPKYREVGREGPAHEPLFTIEVEVGGQSQEPARGEGRSKRLAEQAAAERLLARVRGG